MKLRKVAVAVGLGLAAILLPLTAVPAQAANPYEVNTGTRSDTGPTGSYVCAETTGAKACYVAYGDYLWVRDTVGDSRAAALKWELYDAENGNRRGECVNRSGYGTWTFCNKNYVENHTYAFAALRINPNGPSNKSSDVITRS